MTDQDLHRITVTLPSTLLEEVDRLETNRSRFVAEAIRRELERRRREALELSLASPHPDTRELSEEGFGEWVDRLPAEDASGLLDPALGTAVRWLPGEGWRTR